MTVKQTSKAALDALVLSGKCATQTELIYEYLVYVRSTRKEIAADMGIELSAVCGRVNSLLKDGHIRVSQVRTCKLSGRKVEELTAQPPTYKFNKEF